MPRRSGIGRKGIMKKWVLVADDDPGICDTLSLILLDAGYEVTTTLDGRTVLELGANLPDLILLDIRMSGIDGGEICKHLKSHEETVHIPVIMISANKDTPMIASQAGAEAYVLKPFEVDDLLAIVEQHVSRDGKTARRKGG
jgi:CheY-like chemotaxis protein